MNTIIVQMAEAQWTEEALHLACAMAQRTQTSVVLLNLLPTQHYSWLGTNLGASWLTAEQTEQVWRCKAIADSYGVEFSVQPMAYITYVDALVEICEELDASAVFAHIPDSLIPLWHKYEIWNLRHRLSALRITLYTLDEPVRSTTLTTQMEAAVPHA